MHVIQSNLEIKYFAKNSYKKLIKDFSSKYIQKLIDQAEQFVTDAPKGTSEGVILKSAKTTGNLIGNKIENKITKNSPQ